MLILFLCVLYFRVAGNCPLVLEAICDAENECRVAKDLISVSTTTPTRLSSFLMCRDRSLGSLHSLPDL